MTPRRAGLSLANARIQFRSIATLLLGLLLATSRSLAQFLERDRTAHARYLALNVVIGATASVGARCGVGRTDRSSVAKGLLGGSLMSAGMELIGTESPVDALRGASADCRRRERRAQRRCGVPVFSDVTLPIYPFYVRMRPGSPTPVTARVSAVSAVRLASVMTRSRERIDWRADGRDGRTGVPVA